MSLRKTLEACKIACIHKDILGLPDGYDIMLGDGGVRLSGGQCQRLAMARTLLQNTPIIMMDEATSAVDNLIQAEIMKAVFNMEGRHTVIMVAHRLSTIVHCDRLFFISGGNVLASGTHQKMLENCSEYRALYGSETTA
ncbi:MAG: ATP-binding cassette domain-containing protein [Clostridia bacterium]|nr:ATP-binding cassette domain-containing protein [Clostridia bacterium]